MVSPPIPMCVLPHHAREVREAKAGIAASAYMFG